MASPTCSPRAVRRPRSAPSASTPPTIGRSATSVTCSGSSPLRRRSPTPATATSLGTSRGYSTTVVSRRCSSTTGSARPGRCRSPSTRRSSGAPFDESCASRPKRKLPAPGGRHWPGMPSRGSSRRSPMRSPTARSASRRSLRTAAGSICRRHRRTRPRARTTHGSSRDPPACKTPRWCRCSWPMRSRRPAGVPLQIHSGIGDRDQMLTTADPALLQPQHRPRHALPDPGRLTALLPLRASGRIPRQHLSET